MPNILKFFIISLFFFSGIYNVNAQKNRSQKDSVSTTTFNGLRLDLDISPIVTSLISSGTKNSFETGVYADFKQKYFPTIELGYANATNTSVENVRFTTSGTFARVGVDVNLIKQKVGKARINNIFFAGIRLAYCPFSYSITNIVIPNDYWGGSIAQEFNNQKHNAVWFEIVAGMRVEVSKRIYMGWTARNKNLFGEDVPGEVQPWYIPGFGVKGTGKNWGVNYSIGYKF